MANTAGALTIANLMPSPSKTKHPSLSSPSRSSYSANLAYSLDSTFVPPSTKSQWITPLKQKPLSSLGPVSTSALSCHLASPMPPPPLCVPSTPLFTVYLTSRVSSILTLSSSSCLILPHMLPMFDKSSNNSSNTSYLLRPRNVNSRSPPLNSLVTPFHLRGSPWTPLRYLRSHPTPRQLLRRSYLNSSALSMMLPIHSPVCLFLSPTQRFTSKINYPLNSFPQLRHSRRLSPTLLRIQLANSSSPFQSLSPHSAGNRILWFRHCRFPLPAPFQRVLSSQILVLPNDQCQITLQRS